MEAFADKGIFFKSWYVNVFRPGHKAMYKGLGFRFLCSNKVHGSVYELELPAYRLYTGAGFETAEAMQGFSVEPQDLLCYRMLRR